MDVTNTDGTDPTSVAQTEPLKVTLKMLCQKFCENTTAHGFGRLQATQKKWLRLLWTVLIIAAWCGFAAHLTNLTKLFISQPTSTQLISNGARFVPPDIHLCNPMPFSRSHLELEWDKINNTKSSMAVVKTLFEIHHLLEEVKTLNVSLGALKFKDLDFMAFPATMTQTIDHDLLSRTLGQAINSTIVSARMFPFTPTPSLLYHHKYLVCFTLKPDPHFFKPTLPPSTVDFFTDSDNQVSSSQSFPLPIESYTMEGFTNYDRSSGLLLVITEPGFYPHPTSKSIYLSTATKTTVSLKMRKYIKVNRKFAPCLEDPSPVEYWSPIENKYVQYGYQYDDCVARRALDVFLDICDCLPNFFRIPSSFGNARFCWNATDILEDKHNDVKKRIQFAQRALCAQVLLTRFGNEYASILKHCENQMPCTTIQYSLEWSASKWPLPSFIDTYLDQMAIRVKELEAYNKTVPGLRNLLNSRNNSDLLYTLIHNNVGKLEINAGEMEAMAYVEKLSYQQNQLFSDFGGILGLYLGASLLTLSEVLGLAMRCVYEIGRYLRRSEPCSSSCQSNIPKDCE